MDKQLVLDFLTHSIMETCDDDCEVITGWHLLKIVNLLSDKLEKHEQENKVEPREICVR